MPKLVHDLILDFLFLQSNDSIGRSAVWWWFDFAHI